MTRAERIKIAYEACEKIGPGTFSCTAIALAVSRSRNRIEYDCEPCKEYRQFYKKDLFGDWKFKGPDRYDQRIMAVLFWAHCPQSIRKGIK